ncbi:divalent-cation tolerance protein CutA [Nocardia farcinica]|uniref:divalent-cation tolerance protein CutA n=1 Tax=Nocardia farcinica TaxID=37329 RepID=UPI00245612B1|nr:divalent-cation tolerance protein CutA [Nocardia farcinica]
MADDQIVDVTITADDPEWLAGFARSLVADRLAACGNIIPGVRSIFRWQGEIDDEAETLLVLHTRASLVPRIIERADAEHPYDTPQVLALPVAAAHPGYLRWVLAETRGAHETGESASDSVVDADLARTENSARTEDSVGGTAEGE